MASANGFTPLYSDDLDVRIRHVERFLGELSTSLSDVEVAAGSSDFSEILSVTAAPPFTGPLPMAGDVIGDTAANTIDALQGSPFNLAALAEGDFLVYNSLGEWGNRNWTPGEFGVGAAPTRGRFEVTESEVSMFFSDTTEGGSGLRGLRIDKTDAAEATPHGITFRVANTRVWDIGVDFNTAADGRSYLAILDHTANGSQADVFAISPESQSSISASCKYELGRAVGSPKDQPDFITVNGGDDATALGGIRINYWSSNTSRNALSLLNRHGTSRRAGINFEDIWLLQTDADADGSQEIGFSTGGVTHWTLTSPGQVAQFYVDAGTTNAPYPYRLQHNTSGTAAAGFGVGIQFYGETNSGADAEIAALSAVLTDTTNGSHAGYLSIFAESAGSGVERARFHGDGRAGVASGGANPLASNVLWNQTRAAASAPTIRTYNKITSVADTNITASTEVNDVFWDLARTMTWSTGAITDQRFVRISAPTIAFNGASTVTNAATFAVTGPPVAGSNATLTNRFAGLFDGPVKAHNYANAVVTKTGNYTLTDADCSVYVDATGGAVTITLPPAAGATGRRYTMTKIDASANAATLDGDSAETISGSATQSTTTQWASLTVEGTGSGWVLV